MKKFLLMFAAAFAALTVSAQKESLNKATITFPKKNAVPAIIAQQSVAFIGNRASKPANVLTSGEYIDLLDVTSDLADDDETEIVETSGLTLYVTGKKENYKGAEYDVCDLTFSSTEGLSTTPIWKALYNEKELIIPVNQEYTDAEYGLIYFWGLIQKEDGVYYDDENDIVYTLNEETGVFDCGCIGYAFKMTGEYEQYVWTSSWYGELVIPNGVETGQLGKGGWSEYTNPVFISVGEEEIVIVNFRGLTQIVIEVDEEGNYSIPMHQAISAMSTAYDQETYGYYFRMVGVGVDEEGYLFVDEEIESVDVIRGKLEEGLDGKLQLVESDNNIITDPSRNGYMGIFSKFDAEGQGYYMGYLHSINFTLNEGTFATGIKDVITDKANTKSETYNLAGQKVGKNFKGIVIRNGQKFLNK